ncbi:ABC transporter substrate-binding protein [Paraburkholderia kururiensis]|uniref:ABC transporter substrate-binding protein n=1 Tax=Paraburkholderia kururiensis TaxID=984307 RepID=UPI0005A6E653|nr:ABC transporter substrate-binding protein [Paraburkholderia kururiensis]
MPARFAWAQAAVGTTTASTPRIVVLDWPLTEIVLSIGVVPVGVSRPPWYRMLDGDPPLPASVVDTGLLYQPNFEVIGALKPDLIVVTPWHAPLMSLLQRIAPTQVVPLFGPGVEVYPAVRAATRELAQRLNRTAAADALFARTDAALESASQRLAHFRATRRPVYLLHPIDDRHLSVFGKNSLFGGVMAQLGIDNAWRGPTDAQGTTQADLAALAHDMDAQAVVIGVPPGAAMQLQKSPVWRALPFVQQDRVQSLAPLPALGGLTTSMRFAGALAQALEGAGT